MPADPLRAFLRFSPFRLFSVSLRTLLRIAYSQFPCFLVHLLFFSSEFAFSCGDCRTILSKVNGRKILFLFVSTKFVINKRKYSILHRQLWNSLLIKNKHCIRVVGHY